jgi:hypothetical protein
LWIALSRLFGFEGFAGGRSAAGAASVVGQEKSDVRKKGGNILDFFILFQNSNDLSVVYNGKDEQANDFQRCLMALEDPNVLKEAPAALDATGVAARHLLLQMPLSPKPHLSRVHPLFRKRLVNKDADE